MALKLSGLANLGLDHLEDINIFEKPEEKEEVKKEEPKKAAELKEPDLVYDKAYECPVCAHKFTSKVMKTGKARVIGTDQDLRPRYQEIDPNKYDIILCPRCGYAALPAYFPHVTAYQAKQIRFNISQKLRLAPQNGEIYTYEEAMERYKLALATAVVRHAKGSEKAYICLKIAWLLRGYGEFLQAADNVTEGGMEIIKRQEEEYLRNAYEGFLEARKTENHPMCGMDEVTVDYLLAALGLRLGEYEAAGQLVARLLTSPSTKPRIKEKARELKGEVVAALKKQASENEEG